MSMHGLCRGMIKAHLELADLVAFKLDIQLHEAVHARIVACESKKGLIMI